MSNLLETLAPVLAERATYLAPVLLAALVLGEPLARLLRMPKAGQWVGAQVLLLNRKLNRPQRSIATRLYRGMAAVAMVLVPALLTGLLLLRDKPSSPLLVTLLLVALFGALLRPYARLQLRRQAKTGSLSLSADHPDFLFADTHARLRHAIYEAGQQVQLAIGASCFFLLADMPGLCMYLALAMCAAAYHPALADNRAFGWAAHRLWRAVNAVPYALFLLLSWLAAWCVAGTAPIRTLTHAATARRLHGWAASLLVLAIGGPMPTLGGTCSLPWAGIGTAKVETVHLSRALALWGITYGLWILVLSTTIFI